MYEIRKIPWDSRYYVDTLGNIYSDARSKRRKLKYQKDISGKYSRVCINKKHYLVHRVVAITFLPNYENLPQVNHKDGDTSNNNLYNLEWVTVGENQKHAYNAGLKLAPKGMLNGRQTLSEIEVLEIYGRLLNGDTVSSVSKNYRVSDTQIGRIKSKAAWSHLTDKLPNIGINAYNKKLTKWKVIQLCDIRVKNIPYAKAVTIVNFPFTKHQYYDLIKCKSHKTVTESYFKPQRSETIESTHLCVS